MAEFSEFYNARNFIVDIVKKEVIGPAKADEVLWDVKPLDAYACAILWPQMHNDKETDKVRELDMDLNMYSNDGEVADEEEGFPAEIKIEDPADDNISSAMVIRPSTMGITVRIDSNVNDIAVKFSFAKYRHGLNEEAQEKDGNESYRHIYTRQAYSFELIFDLSNEGTKYSPVNKIELEEMNITAVATKRMGRVGEPRLFTFSITNGPITDLNDISINENSLFQCEFVLTPMGGYFIPMISNYIAGRNIEEDILEMQYKDVYNFAIGHGCATNWMAEGKKCSFIWADFVPEHELMQMKPLTVKDDEIFSLKYLYSEKKEIILKKLNLFVDLYHDWYGKQKAMSTEDEYVRYSKAADECLKNILICEKRIRNGLSFLAENDNAWKAFLYANRAMYYQRISMALMKGDVNSEEEFINERPDPHWYPFQLFYLIMIIPDFVDPSSQYKDVVDLLWFPTGGGKTEAYMAVSAFIIFYERLSEKIVKYGTTILMRYTLRLLTIQQFERAAALICSCERVRLEERISGDEISLGLWIGSDSTPNKIKDAEDSLEKIKAGEQFIGGNPVQLTHCPFCGKKLRAINYYVDNSQHLRIKCGNDQCGKQIPVYVVDTDIYDFMPTLIISTVDKFARIVWDEKAGNIFGCNGNVNKPRLIIQDELHLISGALGTLTGLYESVIDRLCWDSKGNKPKIISSTATVKNARYQIAGLYNRDYFQFPPNGLQHTDSFFAVEATREEKPSRLYVGLSSQGGSIIGLLVKLYSALAVADYYVDKKDFNNEVVDQYYTIIGYFNSIRELGTVSTVLRERIYTHIRSLLNGKFSDLSKKYSVEQSSSETFIYNHGLQSRELTSRKSASEVVDILNELAIHYSDDKNESTALKYVLCSNMFSVGVDIDRLGLMAMYGQPKSNSDYIQATSRVGRSNPGLIFSMYSSVKARDRSYYEQFGQYHSCFYKFVEPTSVTPFSIRSIERGLHSVFVALVRHLCPDLASNASAKKFDSRRPEIKEIVNYLLQRIRSIHEGSEKYAELYLMKFIKYWETLTAGNNLVYDKNQAGQNSSRCVSLLKSAEETDAGFTVLNSLRNVEELSAIYVKYSDIEDV